ncbi:MAG: metal-dependent transcriptional regulator [Candidatus Hadarchaeum sp.]|uniref:metal-dependent transcriptional regulator n=1 Tax=Candidatus Hadarchaeum sp. TaxID=2883567 RepID=UPI0031769E00
MKTKLIVTENEARYLMLIYRRQVENFSDFGTTDIARILKVRPATVTEAIQNLAKKKLVKHRPYHGVQLTKRGVREAQKLLRRHRILELFLSDFLKYDVRKSCLEASKIDYHVSSSLINDICRLYGHPRTCPCKKNIFTDPGCLKERVKAK